MFKLDESCKSLVQWFSLEDLKVKGLQTTYIGYQMMGMAHMDPFGLGELKLTNTMTLSQTRIYH
jgi:hypothetical protein